MCFSCSVEFLLPSSSPHLFPYFTLLYSNNDFQSVMFQSNNPSHFYSTEYFGHCNITMATFEKMSDGSYIIKPIKQKQMVCCKLLVNFNSTEKLLLTLYGKNGHLHKLLGFERAAELSVLGRFNNRTGTSIDNCARKLNNWLDQWQSSKLDTRSSVLSFLRAFPSSTDVPILLLNQPITVKGSNSSLYFTSGVVLITFWFSLIWCDKKWTWVTKWFLTP